MEITRSENTAPAAQAVYTIPADQPEAIFTAGGRRYRAVRLTIFAEGYDGGVRGQDMSAKAWVFAVRLTKKGTDYVSGEGMNFGVDIHSTAFTGQPDPSWGDFVQALLDALARDSWDASVRPGEEDYRFARTAPTTAREAVESIDHLRIDRSTDEGVIGVESRAGEVTTFVGWLHEGQLITSLPDDLYEPVVVPPAQIPAYVAAVVRSRPWNGAGRAEVAEEIAELGAPAPEVREVAELGPASEWLDRMFGVEQPWDTAIDADIERDLDDEREHRLQEFTNAYSDMAADVADATGSRAEAMGPDEVAAPTRGFFSAGPIVLDLPIESVHEGDRLLEIGGAPLGWQAGNVQEQGVLVEHVGPGQDDLWTVTVWMGPGMVELATDAGTKAKVRRFGR